jgi:hypothetical protein
MMRRIVTSIGVTIGSLLATALPAAAQGYVPPPTVQPTVIGQAPPAVAPAAEAAPAAAAPLAFTGAEIGILVLAVALLVTVGTLALIAGRRRAAQVA